MKRVLLTGMSGTGKSTTIVQLAALGYKAVDADEPPWSEWVDSTHGRPSPQQPGRDWVWHEGRIQDLLSTEDADLLFVSGCARNQVRFHPRFDHIVLLSAPRAVMIERLTTRTTNSYGKHPGELAQVLRNHETVEPALRRVASLEVDTSAPAEEVVETVLDHVGQRRD